jgi:hypothetical protein
MGPMLGEACCVSKSANQQITSKISKSANQQINKSVKVWVAKQALG